MSEVVILVDELDSETGVMPKMEAHRKGVLHRAFSVFIFNTERKMLLQKRADDKYHSAGLWSNACCSHPRPGESIHDAAVRRLREEMGIECPLTEVFSFIYKANLENDLIEHEYDHVLIGTTDATPQPDKSEVSDWTYLAEEEIIAEIGAMPECYTAWFKLCVESRGREIFGSGDNQ